MRAIYLKRMLGRKLKRQSACVHVGLLSTLYWRHDVHVKSTRAVSDLSFAIGSPRPASVSDWSVSERCVLPACSSLTPHTSTFYRNPTLHISFSLVVVDDKRRWSSNFFNKMSVSEFMERDDSLTISRRRDEPKVSFIPTVIFCFCFGRRLPISALVGIYLRVEIRALDHHMFWERLCDLSLIPTVVCCGVISSYIAYD